MIVAVILGLVLQLAAAVAPVVALIAEADDE